MLGDKNLACSGVSCVLLAYLAGEIWETAVTSNSNQRSTVMSPCSLMNPPVLKSFHAVQVCWAGLVRMINHLVLEWLFGGQLKQKKENNQGWNKWRTVHSVAHLPKLFFLGQLCLFFFFFSFGKWTDQFAVTLTAPLWLRPTSLHACIIEAVFPLVVLPSFSVPKHFYCRKVCVLKYPIYQVHTLLKSVC